MPVYILAGPAVALIGIISVFFVMRRRAVDKRSMYSSRRSQIERKVRAARQRTLAPRGRGDKAPTPEEIAAAATPRASTPAYQAAAYQAPAYPAPAAPPQQAWEMGASPAAPVYEPPAPGPAYEPPPPPPPPPSSPAVPSTPVAEPVWNPAPSEPVWTPAPAADVPAASPAAAPAPAEEPLTPAGGGASWSIVGADVPTATPERPAKGKDKKRDKAQEPAAAGGAWQLASGDAPTEDGDEEGAVKRPSATMAIAQYAVLVVGLVMVLVGVLVMVANSKVT